MGTVVKPTYIFLTAKPWNDATFTELEKDQNVNWVRIKSKEEFQYSKIAELQPAKIFIPHWSYMIPAEIFNSFECIVFHMTDLPFGRGGSPLQNLIVRGHKNTKISALKVTHEVDAGDIYLKKDLSLEGNASEIFTRADTIIATMISEIILNNIKPESQEGETYYFSRRTPSQSRIDDVDDISKLFDLIRMVDAEGYPKAFFETPFFRVEFSGAKQVDQENLIANVRIFKK